ncbi:MAG: hypothetical protein A2134_01995 [Candidatus Woykebacteria bacterium RBG_16_39_9b]|uniref:Peptidase M23 domain-containing protein n=1 Tax=Candidatus Woykebacteria bacterium RBG_16_39_9b TaxID=1802595 RepID=A0A1G1WBW0_9BACT|nr:MAG: hypothetical protein A2134_01995 [Candidatus Woykebacteria bacterium RBG_16_39_9b]
MLKRILLIFIILVIAVNINPVTILSHNGYPQIPETGGLSFSDYQKKLEENIRRQDDLRRKIAETQSQERTLAYQITYIENQINLRELEIEETETRIAQLKDNIGVLSGKLKNVEQDLNYLTSVSNERLRTIYMESYKQPLDVFIGSSANFNDLIVKTRYAQDVRAQDVALLLELRDTKANYNKQKQELENKKAEEEGLKQKLAGQRADLAAQRGGKENLLAATKNDESRYSRLLAAAQSEARILGEIVFKGNVVERSISINGLYKAGRISTGARVGTMGSTGYPGCSTASHLHLETLINARFDGNVLRGSLINPESRLSPRTILAFDANNNLYYRTTGFGGYSWPMSDPIMTQGYGKTPWSYRYQNNFHTGIDLVDLDSDNVAVKAMGSGTLYKGTITCGGSSPIKVALIDHGGSFISAYWHLQ